MFRTINQTVSNLRSSLPSRGTGEFVESPAHKVSVMVGGQRQQEDLGGGTPTLPGIREGSSEGALVEDFFQRAMGCHAWVPSVCGYLSRFEGLRQGQGVASGLLGRST